ncbi:hypothetical protein RJT34_18160 [Clitoria ternatea]|uniref:Uncharacterized protein n=1 Tax=Clitoria ternatea TaxID=43366 RepID=A0AAN9JDE9_CLITE
MGQLVVGSASSPNRALILVCFNGFVSPSTFGQSNKKKRKGTILSHPWRWVTLITLTQVPPHKQLILMMIRPMELVMAKVRGGPLSPAAHVSPSPSPKRWWPPHPPTSLILPHIPPHFNNHLLSPFSLPPPSSLSFTHLSLSYTLF